MGHHQAEYAGGSTTDHPLGHARIRTVWGHARVARVLCVLHVHVHAAWHVVLNLVHLLHLMRVRMPVGCDLVARVVLLPCP